MRLVPASILVCALAGSVRPMAAAGDADLADSAGDFTVRRFDAQALLQPAPMLPWKEQQIFMRGRKHFDKRWGAISSLDFEWGLGPTFNAKSCAECHVNSGRGAPPRDASEQIHSMLVRLSIPSADGNGAPVPHPSYGDQLQNDALRGPFPNFAYHTAPVPPEAAIYLDWEYSSIELADGERIELRKPRLRIEQLAFGPLGDDTMLSLRIAQPVLGIGLLEAIAEDDLAAIARGQRARGYNGRPNIVRDDIHGGNALGRFGWKANQPSVRQQIAAAALGDMGLTSRLYRAQNCPPVQTICRVQTPGNDPEFVISDWDELDFWTRGSGVPARRDVHDPQVLRGEQLFSAAQCDVCHMTALRTAEQFPAFPRAAHQLIHPYTDLLLHDMGEALSDARPDFAAGPRDWRTAPLWGLGLAEAVNGSGALLHDGRARNPLEAILWHGGEAERSREAVRAMPAADRAALLRFLQSL